MKTSEEIQSLKCGGCRSGITNRLSRLHDVSGFSIEVETNITSFDHVTDATYFKVKRTPAKLGNSLVDEKNIFSRKIKSYLCCVIGKIGN